jgi:hypothetical protein
MTVAIGANLILRAIVGWCPSSLALRRLGVPEAWETAAPVGTTEPSAAPPTTHEAEVVATAR